MNRLSSGSRVTRHTQGLTKSLDAPQKLVVKELELTDFMYVSGPGIVLEEDQPVFFGQSMVPTGHTVQVAINKLDRTLSEATEQLEAKVTDAETRLSEALTSSVPIDQVKVGLGQSLIPNGHSVQVAINKLEDQVVETLSGKAPLDRPQFTTSVETPRLYISGEWGIRYELYVGPEGHLKVDRNGTEVMELI